jgi:RNA polymerase sigma-70 factor (ECF subfamily)
MPMRTDAELLAAAVEDAAPFRELYERYAARVHRYHLRRSRDLEAAYDLTAETFAQAWLSRRRFRDEADGSAGPWLFAIARHVVMASVRRRRLERTAIEQLRLTLPRPRGAVAAEPEEAWLEGLDEAFEDLPDGQREAIRMRVIDDLDYDQVADRLGTSPAAARVRVHRGLATLRHRLADAKEQMR